MKNIVITCILLLFSYQLMAEKIYKWVDKDGNIHYSAQKPVNQDVETVKVRKGPRVKDQDSQQEQTDIKGVQPLQSGSDDEAEAQARDKLAQADAQNKIKMCEQARQNMSALNATVRVTRVDPNTGETVRMTDEERVQAMTNAQRAIDQYCN